MIHLKKYIDFEKVFLQPFVTESSLSPSKPEEAYLPLLVYAEVPGFWYRC